MHIFISHIKTFFKKLLKFNRVLIIIVTLNFCLGLFISAIAQERPLVEEGVLSLKDCIEIAEMNNPSIIQARNKLRQYELKIRQQYASYYPQVNLSSNFEKSKVVKYRYDQNYSHSVKITQDIYTGGQKSSLVEKAKADLLEQQYAYKEIESDEILEVKTDYYQILKEKHLIEVQGGILERRKRNADLIQLFYNAGREKRANLLRAEAEIAKAELDLSKEEDKLEIYKAGLNRTIGRQISAPLTVEGALQRIEFQSSLSELIDEAKKNRPELNQQNAKIRAVRAGLKDARSGLFPKLNFETNWGIRDGLFAPYEDYWDGQLKCTMPVFDGFLTIPKIQEADIEIKNLLVGYGDLEKGIIVEVNEAYLNLLSAQKQLNVSEQTLRAAQLSADLSRLEYKQGAISYVALDDDELYLAQSELDVVDALYELNLKKAELDNIIGR